jgi:hypothetical protein
MIFASSSSRPIVISRLRSLTAIIASLAALRQALAALTDGDGGGLFVPQQGAALRDGEEDEGKGQPHAQCLTLAGPQRLGSLLRLEPRLAAGTGTGTGTGGPLISSLLLLLVLSSLRFLLLQLLLPLPLASVEARRVGRCA